MEIFLIFVILVGSPLLISLPFYAYNRYGDLKEDEAQRIIDKLCGIDRSKGDWPGPN
jgi:hypothetical protein